MSLAQYARSVLLSSPYISVSPFDLHIEFVGAKPTEYSINAEPTGVVKKRYLNGDTRRAFTFSLTLRTDTFTDSDRAAVGDGYEKLALWLERQSRSRKLPPMSDGATPMQLTAIGGHFLMERAADFNSELYTMQFELTYYQKMED